ncbi:hypothetical protein ABH920_006506 [Catenulispora sp. EB89]|uniref:hypothetical protein n=1 Tax=Catenulispora sp. EB89 TaxID=3156257 RepID=UPI0035166158
MKRVSWPAAVLLLLALLAGCSVTPTGVRAAGQAPGGVAPGPTLYYVDAGEHLHPQVRLTGQLGTVAEALSALLSGPPGVPGETGLHTEIANAGVTQVVVTVKPGVLELIVPLSVNDVSALGIEQIVCTALGVHVQGGGSTSAKVQLEFTQPTAQSDQLRTCPLIAG